MTPERIVVFPGRLLIGDGSPARAGGALVIEDGRFATVCERVDLGARPEADRVIDAPDATAMPGLIDAHVHLAYDGGDEPAATKARLVQRSYPALALDAAHHARATLSWGVTTVRDLSAPGGVVIDLRDAVAEGRLPGPRIVACGTGITATGGHMDVPWTPDHVRTRDLVAVADGPDAVRRVVREQAKRGADLIKINLCVGSRIDPERPWRQELADDEVVAAVDEAHRLERKVAAHTSGGPSVTFAVRSGLDSVEHGHWLDEACAEAMASGGAAHVPTLLVNERNFEVGRAPERPGASRRSWLERAREAKWGSVERVHRAGAPIVAGTDAGFMVPHGAGSLAREIELLTRCGLTSLEALRAATAEAADLLGVDAGRLAPGLAADFLLVDGDPVADLAILQDRSRFRTFVSGRPADA